MPDKLKGRYEDNPFPKDDKEAQHDAGHSQATRICRTPRGYHFAPARTRPIQGMPADPDAWWKQEP